MRTLVFLLALSAGPAFASPALPVVRAAAPDVERRLKDDPQPLSGPLRVAATSELALSSASHGAWSPSDAGGWTWRLVVESPGAVEIALTLGAMGLNEDATVQFGAAGRPTQGIDPARLGVDPRWLPLVSGDAFELRLELPAITPESPMKPRKKLVLLLCIISGGFLGLLVALVRVAVGNRRT